MPPAIPDANKEFIHRVVLLVTTNDRLILVEIQFGFMES